LTLNIDETIHGKAVKKILRPLPRSKFQNQWGSGLADPGSGQNYPKRIYFYFKKLKIFSSALLCIVNILT
jgi:hypothetical protein